MLKAVCLCSFVHSFNNCYQLFYSDYDPYCMVEWGAWCQYVWWSGERGVSMYGGVGSVMSVCMVGVSVMSVCMVEWGA